MAEQNNELLMKNHESRPTGTILFPEVNVGNFNNRGRGRGCGRGCGRDRGKGRNNYFFRGGYSNHLNFMPRICSCSSNIERKVLNNILN